jgi:hypothetical protein
VPAEIVARDEDGTGGGQPFPPEPGVALAETVGLVGKDDDIG